MNDTRRDNGKPRRPWGRKQRIAAWLAGVIVLLLLHSWWLLGSQPTPAEVTLAPPGGKTAGRTQAAVAPSPASAPPQEAPPPAGEGTPPVAREEPPAPPKEANILYEEHLTDNDAARRAVVTPQRIPLPVRPPPRPPGVRSRLAVIIDDMGYNGPVSLAIARLPADITLAVLPGGHASREVVQVGVGAGKEVILHQPMEPKGYPQVNPGPGAILTGMSAEQVSSILAANLRLFPEVSGINNHMGSKLTTDRHMMELVMRALAPTGRFFVDSRTANASVAFDMAGAAGIPRARRDVFLDNEEDKGYILRQLQQLVKAAHTQHEAVGIGHAYPATLQALREWLPTLPSQGVELVRVSQMLHPLAVRPRYAKGAPPPGR